MDAYEPQIIADPSKLSTEELVQYLQEELRRISGFTHLAAQGQQRTNRTEPERPQEGQIAFTDGVGWDPGSGAGLYYRSNGAWVFLGAAPGADLYLYNHVVGAL